MGDRGTLEGRRGRAGRDAARLWTLAWLLAAAACSNDHPRRSCAREVWAQPQRPGASLAVVGSWDGWLLPGRPLEPVGDEGWRRVVLDDLPAGEYGYLILEDGDGRIDARNPLSLFWAEQGDLEVSRMEVADCGSPAIEIAEVRVDDRGEFEVEARFLAAEGGGPVADVAVAIDGAEVPAEDVDVEPATGSIRVAVDGLAQGKHSLVIDAAAADEARPASARAVGWVRPRSPTWEGGTLYHVVIDRFRGDGGAALDPPADPGARAGGTLDGVRSAIADGTLDRLGVTALWLSPVYLGPDAARLGRDDDHLYTNYHGYWVEDGRAVEPKIGGEAALRELVASAHGRGIKVLLDVVPNHIYEDNPWAAELAQSGGLNVRDPLCICGNDDCSWGEWIQTCWFTDYLPDLRLKDAAVMARVVADAVWWTETFDLDGVRIDAVPMMPRAATRRIAAGIRASAAPKDATFLLGEVFTGPGAWGIDAIRYYLGPDGIDSVFDFPLMWTMRDVIAHRTAGFEALETMLRDTEAAIEGSGAVLGRFIGNHDTSRFASESAGDLGEGVDPWVNPPPQPTELAVYERQALALGLSLTLPGLAVLYYGDEIGLAGGDDPDCRRVMPADDALLPAQRALREQTERLGRLRRCLPVMASDVRETLIADGDLYAFVRDNREDEPLVVVVNRGDEPAAPVLDLGDRGAWAGEFVDVLSGDVFAITGSPAPIAAPPRSIRALVPAASPCAADPGTSDL